MSVLTPEIITIRHELAEAMAHTSRMDRIVEWTWEAQCDAGRVTRRVTLRHVHARKWAIRAHLAAMDVEDAIEARLHVAWHAANGA